MRTIVDIHILQTVPPSNLNRDDTGSPKTATFGGVRRARVSSQAWKRATRSAFANELDESELGVRTKRVVELIAKQVMQLDPEVAPESAIGAAEKVFTAAKIKVKEPRGKKGASPESSYLLFLSAQQVAALAELAVESLRAGVEPDTKMVQALIKGKNSVDLALFGRMVADVSDLNVDAACQVAHAISTHGVEAEYDYFTAVDDEKSRQADEDAGAGMIGTVEFNSATLYRYATIDADRLLDNLGDIEAVRRAVAAFLRAFAKSMPTGKQNTFANRTLPDAVVVCVRGDQPVSFVGAFEEPIKDAASGGRVLRSAEKLAEYAQDVFAAFGADPIKAWVTGVGAAGEALTGLGEKVGFAELVDQSASLAFDRLVDGRS